MEIRSAIMEDRPVQVKIPYLPFHLALGHLQPACHLPMSCSAVRIRAVHGPG